MQLRVGTSGFSYKEWKGTFYPERCAPADMLGLYAERLSTVEINNTFYRMPKESVLSGWAAQVPEDFRFAIKASRRITHIKRIKAAEEETAYLLGQLEALGERLGVVLFQLPPNLKKDLDRLERFLDLLGVGTRAALEFRHPSWFEDDVLARLRERHVALCVSDTDDAVAPDTLVETAPLGYLRLRRTSYSTEDLSAWALRLRQASWREAYVFLKHEDAGAAPRMAAELLALASPGRGLSAQRVPGAARETG